MAYIRFSFVVIVALTLQSFSIVNGNRVVNGTDAAKGEFPFMVSLQRAASSHHRCGASLLSPLWVLTAAHCVARATPELIRIQYGSTMLDSNSTNVANITKIFVHEGYAPKKKHRHDIALLKLKMPLAFDRDVQAVSLPGFKQETIENNTAIVIGWGLNATGGTVQKHLQKVFIQTFSDAECSERYGFQLYETNICAGVPEGGKGQCNGDSGGPLLVNGTQVGIVSWSRKPCTIAPYLGVFTEVAYYVDWIFKTVGNETLNEGRHNETPTNGTVETSTRRSKMPIDF